MEKIVNRIKNKPGYKFIAMLLLLITPFYLLHLVNQAELNEIKNNDNVEVICYIKGRGEVAIDKNLITGFTEDGGFIFENGYAENCYVNKGE